MTTIFERKPKKETDFDKIKVTSNGTFFMKSGDIFDDKDKSLKLIAKLRNSVKVHNKRPGAVVRVSKRK
ncbi:hypothetical protein [Formosa algae]|uniref:Uncharacterized protein n=1 Tax=Formosa algae TaxID=225843 RepID=A0A9X0YL79_9FLAO|nr:hypothetical protein [Formosa algae]MBP1840013.1 hypothetical protein [Formosa algae]MDQ0335612.1 hypothetical protein [Formosa algae]OEI81694.1 hypothetical protein AST99_02065 [Formosa algae]